MGCLVCVWGLGDYVIYLLMIGVLSIGVCLVFLNVCLLYVVLRLFLLFSSG